MKDKKKVGGTPVGIVTWQDFTFGNFPGDELVLDCGKSLKNVVIRYETYGTLSPNGDNAILVEHALTGNAHLAGRHSPEDRKPGWWDDIVGSGRPLDTDKYFLVCSNCIGGCSGSTGPRSINPETGKRYNLDFPVITIADMVRAQKRLMEHLGIKQWLTVLGGSMGGMLTLEWAVNYPECVRSIMALATTTKVSAQAIAFDWVGRKAIMSDPGFDNGNYEDQPADGLGVARMLAHITYLSDESMRAKFGRELQSDTDYSYNFGKDFQVESYLEHQGSTFVERFDADCYLYITRAMDYYDISARADGDLAKALEVCKCPFFVASFSSDWLFPTYQSQDLVRALLKNGNDVTYSNIESSYGHDAFLLETETLGRLMRNFIDNCYAAGGQSK